MWYNFVRSVLVVLIFYTSSTVFSQGVLTVSENTMKSVYDEIKTPYKYGLVLVPQDDSKKIDCPSVFQQDGIWYMTYIVFDGRGYETWLAKSEDLLQWNTVGRIMSFSEDSSLWDTHQKAGYIALQDPNWNGSYKLQKYKSRYWISYFGGAARGYEAGDLSIGIAFTERKPSTQHEWQRHPKPVLTSKDADTRWWENRKIFKSSVVWDKKKTSGYPFVMYYNANGDTTGDKKLRWFERIGMAVSDDMIRWKRFGKEPIMQHPVGITGDAVIQKINDVWVMFYFGAFWQNKEGAFNRFACSYDLVNWTDWNGEDLIHSSEAYDEKFAHKSFVIKYRGVVYHFYNAVNNKDQRGIAVATSVDKGKSTLNFITK
jgi:predicted GH43/DUF377 family glycosyl hydrolase